MDETTKSRKLGRGLSGLIGMPVVVNPVPVKIDNKTKNEQLPNKSPITSDSSSRTLDGGVREPEISSPSAMATAETVTNQQTGDVGKGGGGSGGVVMVSVFDVVPNRFQPREEFDESKLNALAESIRVAGVMQPIVIRASADAGVYELVAGERRLRAAKLAGLDKVPGVVVDIPDATAAMWAVVENVQRSDLGVLEKARAYQSLAEKFHQTHAEIARQVGEDRSTVTNHIRLLDLEDSIIAYIQKKELSFGHAKVLLSMPSGMRREQLARDAAEGGWSVRELESASADEETGAGNPVGFVRGGSAPAASSGGGAGVGGRADLAELEQRIARAMGTKARIKAKRGATRGEIVLPFYSLDHFDGLMQKLSVPRSES